MFPPRHLATCPDHGLAYDVSLHWGCVLCRRSDRPPPPKPPGRAPVAIATAMLALFAVGMVLVVRAYEGARSRDDGRVEASATKDETDHTRRIAVRAIAPAPLPTAIPLLGPVGRDADGYPTQYVDRTALRSLLVHRKLDELARYFEELQTGFESDPKNEYWPEDAAAAFASAEPELGEALDEWAKATPDSFAPYLARAAHLIRVAWARRGGEAASKTSEASFASMSDALDRAATDLERALALRPKLVAARTLQIHAFLPADGARAKGALAQALASCATCFLPRVAYVQALAPKWGGSHAAMEAFARESATSANPRLRLLRGYVDRDKADALLRDGNSREALVAIDHACALGEHWSFLLMRANVHEHDESFGLALADLDRAAAVRPGMPAILFHRARALSLAKRWEPAGRDLLAGLRVDPTDDYGRSGLEPILQGVVFEAGEHFKAGRRDDALRVMDLANELAPNDPEVQKRRAWVLAAR